MVYLYKASPLALDLNLILCVEHSTSISSLKTSSFLLFMSEFYLKAPNGAAGESLEASADAIFGLSMQTLSFPVCAERGDHRLNKAHKHGPEKILNVGINFFS
jgi:hypothetical protein